MAINKSKPTSAGRRFYSSLAFDEITKKTPEKSLLAVKKKNAGRNAQGRITVRHQGGGNRQKYRIIDFKRNKDDIVGTIATIEYDPNRSANICLVNYADGEKRYILQPKGIKVGDKILSGENVDIRTGNALPLEKIPVGTVIHNIELYRGHGGQLVRSAGASAQILGREGKYVIIRLTSGEMRKILGNCRATIGEVGNADYMNVNIGKAGRKRHMGVNPTNRGSVMNPNDHPHGGGEGKCPVGRDAPRTPWGKRALGVKTRNTKKSSNRLIVRRRDR